MRSSSPVDTPGCAACASTWSVSPVARPASRIQPSSAGPFNSISASDFIEQTAYRLATDEIGLIGWFGSIRFHPLSSVAAVLDGRGSQLVGDALGDVLGQARGVGLVH